MARAEEILQTVEGLGSRIAAYGDEHAERRQAGKTIRRAARQQHRIYKKAVKRQVRQHLRQRGRETRHTARGDAQMARRGLM